MEKSTPMSLPLEEGEISPAPLPLEEEENFPASSTP